MNFRTTAEHKLKTILRFKKSQFQNEKCSFEGENMQTHSVLGCRYDIYFIDYAKR